MAISGRCGDTEVLEWEWRGHFRGCFTVLGHLAFVAVVIGTYSPSNIKFLNKKDVCSRHCPLSENEFLVSSDLGMLFGGRQFPSASLLCGFHLRSQD